MDNKKNTQEVALDALLEKGMVFEVENKGIYRLMGKKSKYHIAELTLGCLLCMEKERINTSIDEDAIMANPRGESWNVIQNSLVPISRALAVAVLARPLKIKLFTGITARYLRNCLPASKVLKLSRLILDLANVGDFINTIRLIEGVSLTTPMDRSPMDHGG